MVARVLESVNQAVYWGGDPVLPASSDAGDARSVQSRTR
jgi:hypothetical protein